MAKGFLFVFALFSMLSGGMPPAAAQENSLNADLNKILASFDTKQGFDPHNAGGLDKVISARGTLVFFDNSHSTGQTPDLSGVFGKKKPNIVRRTLEKAKARLFGSSAEQPRPTPSPDTSTCSPRGRPRRTRATSRTTRCARRWRRVMREARLRASSQVCMRAGSRCIGAPEPIRPRLIACWHRVIWPTTASAITTILARAKVQPSFWCRFWKRGCEEREEPGSSQTRVSR